MAKEELVASNHKIIELEKDFEMLKKVKVSEGWGVRGRFIIWPDHYIFESYPLRCEQITVAQPRFTPAGGCPLCGSIVSKKSFSDFWDSQADCEEAMNLLDKDIHDKDDTIAALRKQCAEVKKLNLNMLGRVQVPHTHHVRTTYVISQKQLSSLSLPNLLYFSLQRY